MVSDGSNQVNLSTTSTNEEPGSWSPDGTKLAFTTSRASNSEVFVMNANGSNPVDLSGSNADGDSGPSWSRDGGKIAFTRDNDVFVMNADGTNQIALTSGPERNSQPAWTP